MVEYSSPSLLALICAYLQTALGMFFVIGGANADKPAAVVDESEQAENENDGRKDEKTEISEQMKPKKLKNECVFKGYTTPNWKNGNGKSAWMTDAPSWTVYHYKLRSNTSGPGAVKFKSQER